MIRLGSPKEGALHGAVSSESAELVRYVLDELKPDVNAKAGWGRAALHEAAFEGEAIVSMLLDASADPNVADARGETPLFYATDHENIPVIKRLLAKGADVSLTNALGQTVADKARWGSAEVKRALGIAEAKQGFGGYGGYSGSEGDSDNDDG